MVDNIVLPGDVVYFLFVPIILASIPGVMMFIKRQELTGSKSTATEYNINSMRGDLMEVKVDVKELRKDQVALASSMRDIALLQEKVKELEQRQDKHEDGLRQIDNIKWRLQNLEGRGREGKMSGGNGAV